MIKKFHHIGIACEEIKSTLEFVKKSFDIIEESKIIFDPLQNANLCILKVSDGSYIELISGETIQSFLEKKQYLYHTCWEVENIHKEIDLLHKNGAILISEPKNAVLFNNKLVAFLFSELGIIELLEK